LKHAKLCCYACYAWLLFTDLLNVRSKGENILKEKEIVFCFLLPAIWKSTRDWFWFALYRGSIKKGTFDSFAVLVISVACHFFFCSGVYRIKHKDRVFQTLLLIEKKKFFSKCLKIAYT